VRGAPSALPTWEEKPNGSPPGFRFETRICAFSGDLQAARTVTTREVVAFVQVDEGRLGCSSEWSARASGGSPSPARQEVLPSGIRFSLLKRAEKGRLTWAAILSFW
jgi:hypothetical protein